MSDAVCREDTLDILWRASVFIWDTEGFTYLLDYNGSRMKTILTCVADQDVDSICQFFDLLSGSFDILDISQITLNELDSGVILIE